MDKARLLNALSKVEWGSLPQPDENGPDTIPKAILSLAAATDEEAATRAYHALLYAIGNNHAGTYYPAVIFVVPALGKIIGEAANWPAYAALNVLIDLYCSFEPQPGFEVFIDHGGTSQAVTPALRQSIIDLGPLIREIAANPETERELRAAATELLEAIS
jgi:hypothetical protein